MNKHATRSWKERFAADLLAIRRRVIADKLRAAQVAADEPLTPRIAQKRRKHFYQKKTRECPLLLETGGSRHFTNASYAAALRDWWVSQTQFRRQEELSAKVEVNHKAVSDWLASKKFPRGRLCDRLFAITRLECFSPAGRKAARREHRAKKVKR
jgi:hypothetical protein